MVQIIAGIILHLRFLNKTLGVLAAFFYLRHLITKSVYTLKITPKKFPHPIIIRIPSSDTSVFAQIFLNQEYRFSCNREPEIIVDAGANIGLASVYFANKLPNARIYAIEPENSNFEILQQNIAPYPNITPIQAALWNTNGEINLVDPGLGKWGFMVEAEHMDGMLPDKYCSMTTAITIDTLMSNFGLSHIDILKMDIEGAEKEVFADSSAWIRQTDALIIELHERMKAGCNRSFYLGSNGFDHEWIQGENVYLSRGNCITRCHTQ